jgi:hypothetical protein
VLPFVRPPSATAQSSAGVPPANRCPVCEPGGWHGMHAPRTWQAGRPPYFAIVLRQETPLAKSSCKIDQAGRKHSARGQPDRESSSTDNRNDTPGTSPLGTGKRAQEQGSERAWGTGTPAGRMNGTRDQEQVQRERERNGSGRGKGSGTGATSACRNRIGSLPWGAGTSNGNERQSRPGQT